MAATTKTHAGLKGIEAIPRGAAFGIETPQGRALWRVVPKGTLELPPGCPEQILKTVEHAKRGCCWAANTACHPVPARDQR